MQYWNQNIRSSEFSHRIIFMLTFQGMEIMTF